MKRDMDLIRSILLEIEKLPPTDEISELLIEGTDADEINYHLKLLHQAGLIEAVNASSMDGDAWIIRSLTWNGHEFLEASRNQTLWNKTKALVMEKGGGLSFEVLKQALVKAALTQIF
jgi:hypothetical protein